MATCPPSFSMWEEDDHDHTSPLLWNRRAEVMAICPTSLSMWDEDDHPITPPFRRDHGLLPSLLLEEGWGWP